MQIRSYMVPWEIGFKSIHIDLDHRAPLTDEAVDALVAEQDRLIKQRNQIQDELRLVTWRLVQSGEAKLKAAQEGTEEA